MSFLQIYLQGLLIILILMSLLWIVSVFIKNVSIVDIFWGPGFVITCGYYFIITEASDIRSIVITILVAIWGVRLSFHIAQRNKGRGEDFRYRSFRKKYGEKRYWWISFFQTFLLQGVLMWLISAPLLGAQYHGGNRPFGPADYAAITLWIVGFIFEAGGDYQLSKFKADTGNREKVLDTGLWKYTRHPNYFGDACLWWGFGLFSISAGNIYPAYGSLLMTALIIFVSGVALLERTLVSGKPQYKEYMERTSPFLPWFPKK